jgi:hypothetical protein
MANSYAHTVQMPNPTEGKLTVSNYVSISLFSGYFIFFANIGLEFTPLKGIMPILFGTHFIGLFVFGSLYFFYRFLVAKNMSHMDYLMLFILFVPIYSGLNASINLNVPIVRGILTSGKTQVLALGALVVYWLMRSGRITPKEYHYSMLTVSWVMLLLYLYIVITVNPAFFQHTEYVGFNPSKGGWVWRISPLPLLYGMIYYWLSYFKKGNMWHLLFFAFFLAYLLFIQKGRIIMFTTMGGLIVYAFFITGFFNYVKRFGIILLFGGAFFYALYLIDPGLIAFIPKMFANFFLVLLGFESGEASADARLIELANAFRFLDKYPHAWVLGSGQLSRDDMDKFYGHIFLTDIGIMGAILVFGIVGTTLYYMVYIGPGIYYIFKTKGVKNDMVFHTFVVEYLLTILQSFFYGGFIWKPFLIIFYLSRLHYYKQISDIRQRQQKEAPLTSSP